jgi:hypothetical protein
MKSKINIILIIVVGVLLWLYFYKEVVEKEVVKTVVKYDTIINTIDNTKPQQIKKVYIRITDTIKESDTITKIVYKDKEVNKYTYKDTLKNGVLTSIILADNIYKRDITLQTFNKTEKTTITKTVFKSALYVGGMITSDLDKSLSNASMNVYYTHRNKFLLTGGLGYGIKTDKPTVNIGLAFKF